MTVQAEIDFGVQLLAGLGQVAGQLETLNKHNARQRARRAELNGKIMPIDLDLMPIQLTAGAGVLDQPRLLGPPLGWTWQLDGIGAQGFTAGSVNTFVNSTVGKSIAPFTAAGVFYQRHFQFLRYGQRLIFQASGITGTAAVWVTGVAFADEIQGEVLL
jgi:hypothetical protein